MRFLALLFILQSLAVTATLYYARTASARILEGEQIALVDELRDDLLAHYYDGGEAALTTGIKDRLSLTSGTNAAILLLAPDGNRVAGNLDDWPVDISTRSRWKVMTLFRTGRERAETIGFVATLLPNHARLLTGHVIEGNTSLLRANRQALRRALVLALPLALVIALVLVRIVNQKAAGVGATVEAVRAGDLSARIMLDGSDDSFDRLSRGVNAMLDRIEVLIVELRTVTDGLAHDLRSPVTRLKSVIEQAQLGNSDPETAQSLAKVAAEADTLLAMLTTALQISRAEASMTRENFTDVDISALFANLEEIYGPLAEDRDIILRCETEAGLTAFLHRDLINQALANLIDNAFHYAEGASYISLGARRDGDGLRIWVADNGPGIAADRHADAIRRFGRLDPARHIAGSGLGLALVEATARLHGGAMVLRDELPGLRVEMWLNA